MPVLLARRGAETAGQGAFPLSAVQQRRPPEGGREGRPRGAASPARGRRRRRRGGREERCRDPASERVQTAAAAAACSPPGAGSGSRRRPPRASPSLRPSPRLACGAPRGRAAMAVGGGWFQVGFRAGWGAGLEPVRLGGGAGAAVRPSWSFVGLAAAGGEGPLPPRSPACNLRCACLPAGAAPVLRGAGGWAALPGDCRDVLPSETHVVLLRGGALEAWRVAAGPALDPRGPVWRRELRDAEAAGEPGPPPDPLPAGLPLVPGGYVVPRPGFFRPLCPALRARRLALGHEHAVLLDAAGDLFTWGNGRHGQLGHGGLEDAAEPRRLEALQGVPMGPVAAGGWHSASVSEAGDLYMWGWNESGQLGLPAKGVPESPVAAPAEADRSGTPSGAQCESPQAAFISIQSFPALLDMPQGTDVSKVSCGSRHTAALTRTGDLYTWGWGKYGQLGHGATATSDRPKKVCCFEAWGLGVEDVVCGPWTTFALALPL
uniref:RCC1 domain-containing protein 1 n=1 Tax=Euleptes europaea TaxID=460621 RepID=UPI0025404BBD|nr:RCC1 domain-containing protein 1 [Euleptes europaea]